MGRSIDQSTNGGISLELNGTPIAPGYAAGPLARIVADEHPAPPTGDLGEARGRAAASLGERAHAALNPGHRDILLAQQAMLLDPEWWDAVQARLESGDPPEVAVQAAGDQFAAALDALDDPYLKARAADVHEVAALWLASLAGEVAARTPAGAVVLAGRLAVADVLPGGRAAAAYIVQDGSPTMHAALIAQNLGVPVVVVDSLSLLDSVTDGEEVAVDGDAGRIVVGEARRAAPTLALSAPPGPVPWRGGPRAIEVRANVGSAEEAQSARRAGADGVGLFRTELFFEGRGRVPSRAEQQEEYRRAAAAAGGPVCFRTFDAGGDKPLAGLTLAHEENPALGRRGMRLYRDVPEVFREQLEAMRTAAAEGPVEVMFPMVATLDDWNYCRDALDAVGTGARPKAVGVMVEVPSLLFLIPELAALGVQFLSLGTNDLTQYLSAVDRAEADRSHLSPLALARAIAHTAREAAAHGVKLAVCGGLAADPAWAVLLAALGVDELSVPVPRVSAIKGALAKVPAASPPDVLDALTAASDQDFLARLCG